MSHKLIIFIINARNEQEAAEYVERRLLYYKVNDGRDYDGATFFSGNASDGNVKNWENLPLAALVTSKEGKALINEAMKTQKKVMKTSFKEYKEKIIKSGILNDFEKISELIYNDYCANLIFNTSLFDMYGNPILTKKKLEDVLSVLYPKGINLYVVPVSVHF